MSDNENSKDDSINQESETKKIKLDEEESAEETEENELKETKKEKNKKEKIPGVVYLSRIPTKMNVKLIREYLGAMGEIDRVYLEPRPENKKRKNQPPSFIEGWVEFKNKRNAKKAAVMLNNKQVGGRRRNPWYHELWNIKYLKNFRWTHLNERLAYEKEMRKQRLRQEVSLAKKEANFFIQNYEKSENRKKMEKRLQKNQQDNKNIEENTSTIKTSDNNNEVNNSNEENTDKFTSKRQHPLFDRKIKIAGNDSFLKQIFS